MNLKKIKRTKICFVSRFVYSLYFKNLQNTFIGGAEVQSYLLANEIAKYNNIDVNVITAKYHSRKDRIQIVQNIKVYNILPLTRTLLDSFKMPIVLFLGLIHINPDIVIQRSYGLFTGICALFCKLFKKKFIYSIAHEIDVNGEAEKGFTGKIFRYGLNNVNYIVAQNEEQIILLENYKKRKFNNIKVIKSGYEIENVEIKKKSHILWVARADKWKRPELFLKLALKFPNEKFIMICNKGQDIDFWNNIRRIAFKIANLNFIEFVSFYEINQYFKDAKIFVNTSIYEGFPNTFIQALKNKTPIISLNVDPDKFLTLNKCGFICNNKFEMMVDYLKKLLKDKKIYEYYSNNAFLYAKKNHNIKNIGKEWRYLIEELNKKYF